MMKKISSGNLFFALSLFMLMAGMFFGLLASQIYWLPNFLKENLGFVSLRPLHVSFVIFWILLSASACVYHALEQINPGGISTKVSRLQFLLWLLAIGGIFYSYLTKDFGGREYWEFNPVWSLPIAAAWMLFGYNFYHAVKKIKQWPVYIWMWMTGIIFFLFTFTENYLWIFPYFREHFITDMTVQWKVNGSLVGAWNQILYGTSIYLMDKISGNKNSSSGKPAFAMYFLGLTNLMFNWGHHIYTLPTPNYIRHIAYLVSMTEWIFFLKIIINWKQYLSTAQKHYHHFPYRFLMAADIWVFLNLFQALLMSIPAFNLFTHGTHVTVAHAMGTTIGINSMIIMAAAFLFLAPHENKNFKGYKILNFSFWGLQISLLVFWLSLNMAGIMKGFWQMRDHQEPFSLMMNSLKPYFMVFAASGFFLLLFLSLPAIYLLRQMAKK